MTAAAAEAPGPGEPASHVGWSWIAAVALANWGLWVALFGPIQLLLAQQAQAIAPDDKLAVLGMVAAAGAACSMVANPLFGALSDRTRSRLGRRRPWVLLGAIGGAASLALLATTESVAGMAIGWCLAQTTLNAMFAALVATIADEVPVAQRGAAGAWLGMAQTGGIVGGVAIAQLAAPSIALGYLACAGTLLLATVPYLAIHAETRPEPVPPQAGPRRLRIDPRRYPDLAWAWLLRFLFNLSFAIGVLYLLYYLGDVVRRPDPAGDVLTLTALTIGVLVLVMIPAGLWSDRLRRRKPFVVAGALLLAAGMAILAVSPGWTWVLAAAAILGAGFGLYTAVEVAIMTQVLPDAAGRGRDLGLLNIANALPQVVAPALAGIVVASAGYAGLYGLGAVLGLCGLVAVLRIRAVG